MSGNPLSSTSAPAKRITAEEVFSRMADGMSFTEGVTRRSMYRIAPPLHIVLRSSAGTGSSGPVTLCTYAPALEGSTHPGQKYCSECVRLGREQIEEDGE